MFGFLLSNTSKSEEHTIANEWKKQNELEFFVLKLKLRDTVELDNIQDRLMCWVLGFLVFVFVLGFFFLVYLPPPVALFLFRRYSKGCKELNQYTAVHGSR